MRRGEKEELRSALDVRAVARDDPQRPMSGSRVASSGFG
jgi:hypothetical protein